MTKLVHRLRTLFDELRRRKVVRAVLAYSAGMGGLMALADRAQRLDWTHLPSNSSDIVFIVAILGLPVVILISWLFELVPEHYTEGVAQPLPAEAAEAPPPAAARESLPKPGTPFIGREAELRELTNLLRDPATRLVTVIGPGGIGKTRLALSAAEAVETQFAHGLRYVPLSGLPTADLLVPAIADSLGIRLSRRDDPEAELIDFLREKQLLLVLDNFDHLTAGAGVLAAILEAAPRVRVLITSRERLNLLPETLLSLEGLSIAGSEDGDSDAVQLFVAVARRQDRRFELHPENREHVQRICELVDGMPLAIELAASWVRVLSCAEIHAELARDFDILSSTAPDVPERHRSLRAAFSGSWRQLSAEEQRAVAYLSVIRSDFDRETAVAVADADVPMLRTLLDKSLLTRADDQLLMLEVVRQYALERLAEYAAAKNDARQRHLQFFADLLAGLEYAATRSDPKAFARIAEDIDDVRAAWGHATSTADADALLRAANTLYSFYDGRGWWREGAGAFARAAEALAAAQSRSASMDLLRQRARTRLTLRAAGLLNRLARYEEAESFLQTGIAAAREADDVDEILFALGKLASNRLAAGTYDEAEQFMREEQALAESRGTRRHICEARAHLGHLHQIRGDYDQAWQLITSGLELARAEGDRNAMWIALNNLGVIAANSGQYAEAARRFAEVLELQRELGNQLNVAIALHNLGHAALDQGDPAAARDHMEEGLRIARQLGHQRQIAVALSGLSQTLLRLGDATAARVAARDSVRHAAAAHAYPLALSALLNLARVRLHDGDADGAAALAAVVAAHVATSERNRREASELLRQMGSDLAAQASNVDLDAIIADIVAEDTVVRV